MENHTEDKKLVLIVDDDPKVLKFIEVYLHSNGFEAIKATSGEEAMELVHSQKPHIIILDLVLPGMSGLEMLRQLRASDSIPIIAFSASSNKRDNALLLGADCFMSKPFNPEEMIGKIRMLLNR